MAKTVILILLLAASGWADSFTIACNASGDADDGYLRSDQPTSNYGTATTCLFGYSSSGPKYIEALIRIEHIADSLTARSGIYDSALITFKLNGALTDPESLRVCLWTVKQNSWTESGATWNTYNGSSTWATAGCAGDNDRFVDSVRSLKLIQSNTGSGVTFTLPCGTQFDGDTYKTVLLHSVSYYSGTTNYLYFYTQEESTQTGPSITVYYHAAATGCPKGRHGPDGNWTSSGTCGNGEAHK